MGADIRPDDGADQRGQDHGRGNDLGVDDALADGVGHVQPKRKAAAKLKKAAQSTAWRGESTRVEMMVATELAASFMPLMKSNSRARKTMMMISISMAFFSSGVFQDDAFGDVGHVLAAVGGPFDVFQDILPLDQFKRVFFLAE